MRSITLFVALVLTSCGIVSAQSAPAEAALEQEIRRLEAMEIHAVLHGDVAALETLWAEQFTVNNPQNGISPDRTAVIDRVQRGLIRYSDFQQRIEAIRFHGDIAIVMGSETVVPKNVDGSSSKPVQRRFTNIWRKSGTTWRVIARHANVVPDADAEGRSGTGPGVRGRRRSRRPLVRRRVTEEGSSVTARYRTPLGPPSRRWRLHER